MVKCSAPLCGNATYKKTPEISFHRFPKDENMKLAWVTNMKRQNWQPTSSSVLCSKHFEANLIDRSGFRTVFAPGAIPTIFDLVQVKETAPVSPSRNRSRFSTSSEFYEEDEVDMLNVSISEYMMTPCDLEMCRVCFATDCKLYPMKVYKKLDKAYKMLTGLWIKNEDNLPPYMCTECAHRLLNCIRFRARSLRAHLIMLEVIQKHKDVTLESIKSVVGDQRVVTNLRITHNETDKFDLEIEHGVQINAENIASDIKEEYDDTIDHNDGNASDDHLPEMEEEVEHDIKVEWENIDVHDSTFNYDYRDDAPEDVIDQVRIKTQSVGKEEKLDYRSSIGNAVVQELNDSEVNHELVNGNLSDNIESHKMAASHEDTTEKDMVSIYSCKDEKNVNNSKDYVNTVPDWQEKMLVDDNLSCTSNNDT